MYKDKDYIFYTDDDIDDQELFVEAVHEVAANLQVSVQGNGSELLNMLKRPPYPGVIFLDLNMPIKNGYEVLKEIKQSDNVKDLPIVVFTTSNDAYSVNESRKLGANLYISKPSSFTLLKNMVKHVISIDWETFNASEEDFVYRII